MEYKVFSFFMFLVFFLQSKKKNENKVKNKKKNENKVKNKKNIRKESKNLLFMKEIKQPFFFIIKNLIIID